MTFFFNPRGLLENAVYLSAINICSSSLICIIKKVQSKFYIHASQHFETLLKELTPESKIIFNYMYFILISFPKKYER